MNWLERMIDRIVEQRVATRVDQCMKTMEDRVAARLSVDAGFCEAVAEYVDEDKVAENVDAAAIAAKVHVTASDIAELVDVQEIADCINTVEVATSLNTDKLALRVTSSWSFMSEICKHLDYNKLGRALVKLMSEKN